MKEFNLDEYLKNPKMKVVTRDGRNVTIHCTNYDSLQPIIAEVEGCGISHAFHKDGRYFTDRNSHIDLFFAPEKHEGWVNIYEYGRGKYITSEIVYTKKEDAIMGKNKNYLTTIKIEWEE